MTADKKETLVPLSNLERRAIQAPLAARLIREYAGHMGMEKSLALAEAAIAKDAYQSGRAMAEKLRGNSLEYFFQVVQDLWAEDGALEVEIGAREPNVLAFKVLRCRYVELYASLGMKELGYCLSCSRDAHFARGFNPAMKLTRTATIMQGAEACDFRFTLEAGDPTGGGAD